MNSLEIFPWNENFESGILIIDQQHMKLVDLLNLLVRQIAAQSETIELNGIFDEIKDYVAFHFATEEEIWKNHFEGDVWEKWHHQSHVDFTTEVSKIRQDGGDKPYDEVLLGIVRFLTHWLARHILDSDKRMAKVVLALPSGISLARAKEAANEEMAGSTKLLIDTLMTMYDRLADSTVQMSREIQLRKKAEEALNDSKQILESASRAKSAFLANMSHELRTPLNAILGYSDILRRDILMTDGHREILEVIHRSGNHLLSVINDVLEITKLETGRMHVDATAFDLTAMVGEVIEMLSLKAREKSIQLLVETSPSFPHYVFGDEAKIRQILINLLSNAVKATSFGQVVLRLAVSPIDPRRIIFNVIDTGVGIAPDDQKRIFEPFEQVGTQAKWQGTGLGLPICHQFAELMGGQISLSSDLGKGSSFRVEIPVEIADHGDIPASLEVQGEVTGIEGGRSISVILVAEDNLENQSLLVRILERVGFPVVVAEDGIQAVEQFKHFKPSFIWMNRRMPNMDGLEAARRIRELPGGDLVKLGAVTASSLQEDDDELIQAGFQVVVHKPFKPEQIYDCMEAILDIKFLRIVPPSGAGRQKALSTEAFTLLADDLQTEFLNALTLLDQDAIYKVIARIESADAELAASIREKVKQYDYAAIRSQLKLI